MRVLTLIMSFIIASSIPVSADNMGIPYSIVSCLTVEDAVRLGGHITKNEIPNATWLLYKAPSCNIYAARGIKDMDKGEEYLHLIDWEGDEFGIFEFTKEDSEGKSTGIKFYLFIWWYGIIDV